MTAEGRAATYRERTLARIRPYTPEDREDFVRFRRRTFGDEALIARPEYTQWLYERALDGDRPAAWLYRADSGVEGFQGIIRTEVFVAGRPFDAAWAAEVFVSPAFLLRGVGAVLAEIAREQADVLLAFEVTEAAKRGFLRTGWSDLGDVRLNVRPLRTAVLAAARGKQLDRRAATALDLALRAEEEAARGAAAGLRARFVRTDRFDERVDALWQRVAAEYPVICKRDAATLNWRFAEAPERGRYHCHQLERGDELLGYAVLRHGEHGGVRGGWIADFLCTPRVAPLLLNLCSRTLRDEGLDAVYCIQPSRRLERAFTLSGFRPRSTGWPLMVHAGSLPRRERDLLTDAGNWFLTAADSNVDRPRDGIVYAV
jgi:hypothetical protein